MACWKTEARKFDDTNITSFPSQVGLDDPNLPRLGRCGCTICNNCVRLLEQRRGDADACPCPYCGNINVFSRRLRYGLLDMRSLWKKLPVGGRRKLVLINNNQQLLSLHFI
jgi:hypothetical protein